MRLDRKALRIAAEVTDLLVSLAGRCPDYLDMPYDDLPYGEAVCRWEDNGSNPRDFFTTEDPYLLYFRAEIVEHFLLRILSPAEAVVEREFGKVSIFRVTGFPSISEKFN